MGIGPRSRYGPATPIHLERVLVFMVLVLAVCPLTPAICRDDPIEVLCLTPFHGISWYQQRLRKEPMFEVTYIPSERYSGTHWGHHPEWSHREVRRFIRRYFPRNYRDLTGNYEFILLLTFPGGGGDSYGLGLLHIAADRDDEERDRRRRTRSPTWA